jgi:hypothetical protein
MIPFQQFELLAKSIKIMYYSDQKLLITSH